MNNKDLLKLLNKLNKDDNDSPTQKNEERIIIIDGLNLFFRNFAVLNYINSYGVHIGGLSGFLRSLGSLVKQLNPTSVYVVFDGVGSTIARKNLLPEYKSNRNSTKMTKHLFTNIEEENESKSDQISRLVQYLQCLPIKILSLDKVEADDAIAFLSKELTKTSNSKVYVVSADKDFLQIVDDKITVYSPVDKEFFTPQTVKNKYGLHSYNFLMYKTLKKDTSDNVGGVQGLGPKKLPKLFPELFRDEKMTLDTLYKICEEKHKDHIIYSRIIFNFEDIKRNYKIMNLENPMLGDEEKNIILNHINSPPYKLDIVNFNKMYNEDGLMNVLKNIHFWIRDTWNTLDRYNKTKINKL